MILKRYGGNPLLKPLPENKWEAGAVFNCGVVKTPENRIVMLYRAIAEGYRKSNTGPGYENYVSSLGLAFSNDGYTFERFSLPAVEPDSDFDRYGCEDPRITRLTIDDRPLYAITYTAMNHPAFSSRGGKVGLILTEDFKEYRKQGVVIPFEFDKDAVIFPERINGKIIMFHRIDPDIQIVSFDSLEDLVRMDETFWNKYYSEYEKYTVLKKRFDWEAQKIGSGPPPVKTDRGWLFLYHAVDKDSVYRAGVALLDLEDPSRVIARSPYPLLEPEEEYEKYGDVNNVIFPEGAVILDDTLFVYYGSADKYCSLATVKVHDLLDYLEKFPV